MYWFFIENSRRINLSLSNVLVFLLQHHILIFQLIEILKISVFFDFSFFAIVPELFSLQVGWLILCEVAECVVRWLCVLCVLADSYWVGVGMVVVGVRVWGWLNNWERRGQSGRWYCDGVGQGRVWVYVPMYIHTMCMCVCVYACVRGYVCVDIREVDCKKKN